MKIGDVRLKNNVLMAPMVDVTDLPYRIIARKAGAGMAYTEMLNIGAILHENKKTLNMLKTSKEDNPSGIQITGRNVEEFRKVVPYLKKFRIVDINCGCPSSRITDNESGSWLLNDPDKIASMLKVLKGAGFVATAKIRLGFKNNNVIEIAKKIDKAGADALTVHGRLASQGNSVPADWKWIKKVKDNIGIPVIGNGDINSGAKAKEMLDFADGVMVARAAIGNPLIFKQILGYLKTGKDKEIKPKDRVKSFLDYLKLARKYDVIEMSRIKYLGGNFFSGFEGAGKVRNDFMRLGDYEEIVGFSRKILETFK